MDVKIAMDCAASEFATCENGQWFYDYRQLKNGAKKDPNGKKLSADEQIAYLEQLITKYPIDSIEDGLDENDWDNWVKLTEKIGDRMAKYNQLIRIEEELGDTAVYGYKRLK